MERVFVDLQAVYPNASDLHEEMSFEELRADSRGWLSMDWTAGYKEHSLHDLIASEGSQQVSSPVPASVIEDILSHPIQHARSELPKTDSQIDDDNETRTRETKAGRPKKIKIREVKGETQTSTASHLENCNLLTFTS